jgi:pimeloyl-ACP methyl ester carboxylesterase
VTTFRSFDGTRIDFELREGDGHGRPVVLVHGFASSRHANWELPGWLHTLAKVGRSVVALDCRGHGNSEKPHAPEAYAGDAMSRDVLSLIDHLGLGPVDLMGYSMGGRIAAQIVADHADRLGSAVLAGVGASLLAVGAEQARSARIADVMEARVVPDDAPAGARAFRVFAEAQGGDRIALAACMRGSRRALEAGDFTGVDLPVLVVVGRDDDLIGNPRVLADAIPDARLEVIPGRDHLSVVPSRAYKEAVLRFWGEDPAFAAPPALRARA